MKKTNDRNNLFTSLVMLVKKFDNWEKEYSKNQDIVDNGGYPENFEKVDNKERIFINSWNSLFPDKKIEKWFAGNVANTMASYRNTLKRMCLDTNNFLTISKFAEHYNINENTAMKIWNVSR